MCHLKYIYYLVVLVVYVVIYVSSALSRLSSLYDSPPACSGLAYLSSYWLLCACASYSAGVAMTRYYQQYTFGQVPDSDWLLLDIGDFYDAAPEWSYLGLSAPIVRLGVECDDPGGNLVVDHGSLHHVHRCIDGLFLFPRGDDDLYLNFYSTTSVSNTIEPVFYVYSSVVSADLIAPQPVYLEVRSDDPLYGMRPVDLVLASSSIGIFLILALLLGMLAIRNRV